MMSSSASFVCGDNTQHNARPRHTRLARHDNGDVVQQSSSSGRKWPTSLCLVSRLPLSSVPLELVSLIHRMSSPVRRKTQWEEEAKRLSRSTTSASVRERGREECDHAPQAVRIYLRTTITLLLARTLPPSDLEARSVYWNPFLLLSLDARQ